MSKLQHTFISVLLSTTTVVSFSGVLLPVAEAQQGESSYHFTRDLTVGKRGDDVKALQQFLNSQGTHVSASGAAGSPGNETVYFGGATRAALALWQAAHGVTPSVGYFGPRSRSAVAQTSSPIAAPAAPSAPSSPIFITDVPAQTGTTNIASGLPVRLKIPKIKIDATVEQVSLTSEGAMDSPKGPSEVGWFNLGPRPGEEGSSVIAGHSGWKNGIAAAFDNLYKLRKGDKIYIVDESGATTTFIVRETRTYDPKASAEDVFGSSDGKAHLNLVTCAGEWDTFSKSSSERLVVFTDKEISISNAL